MQDLMIETMDENDLDTAISWAEKEGWEPGLFDSSLFYQADRKGFFKGVISGEIIATGSAVIYDEHFAFCGLYIVKPEYRGMGYGLALTKARHQYCGNRNIGIDGVLENEQIYRRLGFESCCYNARYALKKSLKTIEYEHIVPLSLVDNAVIMAFDKEHFPAKREAFLTAWITQDKSLSLGFVTQDKLEGYGVIRACKKAFKIGPLFAQTPEIADILFRALASYAEGEPVYLDIPENNPSAVDLVKAVEMEKVFATVRMYTKYQPKLKDNEIFGITSFELG